MWSAGGGGDSRSHTIKFGTEVVCYFNSEERRDQVLKILKEATPKPEVIRYTAFNDRLEGEYQIKRGDQLLCTFTSEQMRNEVIELLNDQLDNGNT